MKGVMRVKSEVMRRSNERIEEGNEHHLHSLVRMQSSRDKEQDDKDNWSGFVWRVVPYATG